MIDIELSVPRIDESPLVVPIPVLSAEDEEELPPASIDPVEEDEESVVDSEAVELSLHEEKVNEIAVMIMKRFIMLNVFDYA
ncbi:MAG: hypothetical protein ABIR81_10245 [Ginsengibacter sp.]